MKKIIAIFLVFIMLLVITSCNKSTENNSSEQQTTSETISASSEKNDSNEMSVSNNSATKSEVDKTSTSNKTTTSNKTPSKNSVVQDSISSEQEPVKNIKDLVDFIIEVKTDKDPIVLQITDPQIIDSNQRRYTDRISDNYPPSRMEEMCFKYIRETVEKQGLI